MNSDNFKIIDVIIRITVITFISIWCFTLLRPFISIILWGTIIAVGFYPLFQWLKNRLGGRANLAAIIDCDSLPPLLLGPVGLMAKRLS